MRAAACVIVNLSITNSSQSMQHSSTLPVDIHHSRLALVGCT